MDRKKEIKAKRGNGHPQRMDTLLFVAFFCLAVLTAIKSIVYDRRDGDNTTNDGTHVCQEVQERLADFGVANSDWTHVVEDKHAGNTVWQIVQLDVVVVFSHAVLVSRDGFVVQEGVSGGHDLDKVLEHGGAREVDLMVAVERIDEAGVGHAKAEVVDDVCHVNVMGKEVNVVSVHEAADL